MNRRIQAPMIALAVALGFAPAAHSQAEEPGQMNAIEYQTVNYRVGIYHCKRSVLDLII